MHDGLHGDDIYIMVEDEFHAVAQTFTQHLHHAEYLRLKNLAKSRTASSASTISRPVDSITAMRNETKKKKQAERRDVRTKSALQQIKGATRPASEERGLSDADNTQWRGTALQGLMTVSPTKTQVSLAGLQGVKSSTRAAAGYSKAEKNPLQTRAKAIDLRPSRPKAKAKALSFNSTLPKTSNIMDDDSSTDDLDAPTARPHKKAPTPPRKPRFHRSLKNSSPSPPPHHRNQVTPPGRPNPPLSHSKPRLITHSSHPITDTNCDPDGDSDSATASTLNSRPVPARAQNQAARRRLKARIARREREDVRSPRGEEIRGAVTNANEIPVFLV